MRDVEYKDFSLDIHRKNNESEKPNSCQFELTFRCGLHCKHCYSDCYNNGESSRNELSTQEVKTILDKVFEEGVLWLTFTGGDPLVREDFLDIYSYAKSKGFIIKVFTNACSVTAKIADYFSKAAPFEVEITLNAVTDYLYDAMTCTRGNLAKAKAGIDMLLSRNIPVSIKTHVTADNLSHVDEVAAYVESLGLKFRPNMIIHPRLNGDLYPCSLRISNESLLRLKHNLQGGCIGDWCDEEKSENKSAESEFLFKCTVTSADNFYIDPYGRMFLCNLIREPSVDLTESGIKEGIRKLKPFYQNRKLSSDSQCLGCDLRSTCFHCPGYAFLEMKDINTPVPYFCELAKYLREYDK